MFMLACAGVIGRQNEHVSARLPSSDSAHARRFCFAAPGAK